MISLEGGATVRNWVNIVLEVWHFTQRRVVGSSEIKLLDVKLL